jgi:ATP/maltotriose-dependent transcriptional regulator MalT
MSRIFMAEGLFERASGVLDRIPERAPPRAEYGEYLVGRALVLACTGDARIARELAARGLEHTRSLQVRSAAPFVMAIAANRDGRADADDLAVQACEVIEETGDIDTFVATYRACPWVLEKAARDEERRRWLIPILAKARDDQIARHLGLPRRMETRSADVLSRREREVFDLLAQGLTNRQIAQALWITESTAKVHVRHIFEKLGVKSRVEAASKAPHVADSHATSAKPPAE